MAQNLRWIRTLWHENQAYLPELSPRQRDSITPASGPRPSGRAAPEQADAASSDLPEDVHAERNPSAG
jgi:hypothetical protein